MKKVACKASPTATSLIHELNALGQHRIVQIRNGIPTTSPWFEYRQIAVFGQYRAVVAGSESLPTGIFKVSAAAHEVLGQ